MKKLTLLLFLALALNSYSQRIKIQKICENMLKREALTAYYNYTDGKLTDINIVFSGQDHRFHSGLISYINLFSGTPENFYNFLTEIENFYQTSDHNTIFFCQDHKISHGRQFNINYISISERKNQGHGYHNFNLNAIKKYKKKLEKWAAKENIDLKEGERSTTPPISLSKLSKAQQP